MMASEEHEPIMLAVAPGQGSDRQLPKLKVFYASNVHKRG